VAVVSDQLRALAGTIVLKIVLISQYFNVRRVSFSNIRLLINTVWLMRSLNQVDERGKDVFLQRESTWKNPMIRMMLVD